jgi:pimeloyl-ACP methyl ester carboxylesterase
MKNPTTILFVTGAFVTHHCWNEWVTYFESKGYKTMAPPWPYKDAPTAAKLSARQPNDIDLARLTLDRLVDHYATIAASLPEKPIIIGHSLGGLITQILLNRGFAQKAVAIHPVPPQGIFPYEFSFLKSTWRALGLFTSLDRTYQMSFSTFQYAFVNGMEPAEQRKAYQDLAAPESKRVARGGLTSAAAVDWKKTHAPLLITSGDQDNIIPAHLNKRNFEKYKKDFSVTAYKEFKGRNHFVLGLPTWKEDADYILNWLASN